MPKVCPPSSGVVAAQLTSASDEKHQRELASMCYICDQLLKPISETVAKEFMELWEEYEEGKSQEAIFVKDGSYTLSVPVHHAELIFLLVDRFELVIQTIEYEKKYDAQKDLKEFLHVRKGIKNEFVKQWVVDAIKEREVFWKSKGIESMIN